MVELGFVDVENDDDNNDETDERSDLCESFFKEDQNFASLNERAEQ